VATSRRSSSRTNTTVRSPASSRTTRQNQASAEPGAVQTGHLRCRARRGAMDPARREWLRVDAPTTIASACWFLATGVSSHSASQVTPRKPMSMSMSKHVARSSTSAWSSASSASSGESRRLDCPGDGGEAEGVDGGGEAARHVDVDGDETGALRRAWQRRSPRHAATLASSRRRR
jgi:hypothetical protein